MRRVAPCVAAAVLVSGLTIAAQPASADGAAWRREREHRLELRKTEAASETSIVGGKIAPPGAWPFQVAVLRAGWGNNYQSEWCGGTLIDKFHVVSAAHCVFNMKPSQFSILTGTQSLALGGTRRAVRTIQIHPKYDDITTDYDIALITLVTPATEVKVFAQMIGGTQEQSFARPGTAAYVVGWGSTVKTGGGYPRPLMQAELPVVSGKDCNDRNSYNGAITPRMICAGPTAGGKDSCDGDSGGPLIVKDGNGHWRLQVGIVSWGADICALRNKYGVYSRLAVLSNWVRTTIAAQSSDKSGGAVRADCTVLTGAAQAACLDRAALAPE